MYQVFQSLQQLVKVNEGALPLHVGVLCHMASGARLFCSVGHGNTEHITKGGNTRLQVELGGLREVSLHREGRLGPV